MQMQTMVMMMIQVGTFIVLGSVQGKLNLDTAATLPKFRLRPDFLAGCRPLSVLPRALLGTTGSISLLPISTAISMDANDAVCLHIYALILPFSAPLGPDVMEALF